MKDLWVYGGYEWWNLGIKERAFETDMSDCRRLGIDGEVIPKINWNPEDERIGVFKDNRTDDLYNSQAESKWETQASTKSWEFSPIGDLKVAWRVGYDVSLGTQG